MPSDNSGTLQPVLARYSSTDERFVARTVFQRCLLLHLYSPRAISCPCQADGKKEGKERRGRKDGIERKRLEIRLL